ncbi:Uncharacterised protein [Sphingobacterium daejeonense]|nr:Uncharacterised protein [Sphingobacterium daejeonense]
MGAHPWGCAPTLISETETRCCISGRQDGPVPAQASPTGRWECPRAGCSGDVSACFPFLWSSMVNTLPVSHRNGGSRPRSLCDRSGQRCPKDPGSARGTGRKTKFWPTGRRNSSLLPKKTVWRVKNCTSCRDPNVENADNQT